MARLIFVNRFFFPDHSATSQILSDLAFHLAAGGHAVQVITSTQRYDDPRASLPALECINAVTVHRVSTTRFGRLELLGRGFDYLSFYAAMWRCVAEIAKPGDILVAKTDPPMLCLPAMHAARRGGLRFVNWLQDVYPEVAMRLGVPLVRGQLGRTLGRLRDDALRAADVNVVVGERMAATVRSRGIAADRIRIIPNWCDDEVIRPSEDAGHRLRQAWGLEGRFVVGYSGNLGRGHEFDTVLAAAEQLRNESALVFLFIGGGYKFDALARNVRARNLDAMFRFVPYQDRAVLQDSLAVPDVHWISLKPELEGLIVPSKVYGIAAAGRPLIAVTARDGEIAELTRRHGCGIVVEPGAAEALATVLRRFNRDRESLAAMGRRARQMIDLYYSRQQALAQWQELIECLAPSAAKPVITP
jgi:colanic acid biosynthesis glycosyl transferase WcaI